MMPDPSEFTNKLCIEELQYIRQIQQLNRKYQHLLKEDTIIKPEEKDDTEGDPIGWKIVAIGNDGSVLCRAPNGKRVRYLFERKDA